MITLSRTLCIAALLVGGPCYATSSLSSEVGEVIANYLNSAEHLAVTFNKKKLNTDGCRQREYELTMTQALSPRLSVEATLNYEKGRFDYGVLNQRVSSKGYQLASWYQMDGFSVGVSNKVISAHEIKAPLADPLNLPTSEAMALNIRTLGFHESHHFSVSAVRETWQAESSHLDLPWTKAYDNQLKMSYSIIF
jgi:hypothetical protein